MSTQFKCKYGLIVKNVSISSYSVYSIHFSISMLLTIDRALSGATTPGQSGPGSDGNEGVLRIPQSSSTAGTSPSNCLVSYPGHSLGGRSYPSAEVQSVYSTAPADWAIHRFKSQTVLFQIIQFSISTQFRRQKQFYFEQFSSALVRSSNVKTVLF